MVALNALKKGESGTIHSFSDEATACKMMSMGILPGSVVKLIRKSPFGGAIYIKADRHQFAIRNTEAACIVLN